MPPTDSEAAEPPPDQDGGVQGDETKEAPQPFKRGFRFWCIIFSLCTTGILSALEGTVVSTALPTIIDHLGGGSLYLWAVNAYFLTSTVIQPLYGQTANIFGRRYLLIFAVAVFALGSGICGGASSMEMLIAGRAIQGMGGGGLTMLPNVIISDIVPLRDRGTYLAIIFLSITVGNGIGPFLGGVIVQSTSWRWVFYLNLPISGVVLVLLYFFLHVNFKHEPIAAKLRRIDYGGNVLFIGSTVAILLALTSGGVQNPWNSWRTIVPLVIGAVGLVVFFVYQRYPAEPTMPLRLFTNRTTVTAFFLTFLHSILTFWVIYFLPVYFQGVLASSPSRSGVQLLPTVLILIPFAAVSGKLLGKLGKYKPLHFTGFAIMTIGFGLFTLLRASSSTAAWVLFQAVEAAGAGVIVSVLLPAIQAPLSQKDVATATGTFAFVRSFGIVWAVTVPATIFNHRLAQLANARVSDPDVRAALSGGAGYEHATRAFLDSLSVPVRREVVGVYTDTLKLIWQVGIGIAGLGFCLVAVEKQISLQKDLDTEFGVKDKEASESAPGEKDEEKAL
ncbi:major facilitator superfamily protein [Westerdykella ornata]|uniref:Major facilitator superfamily protein n=1 Tax=Westerdykella ornata TaxID=318751 RepID=A0A6A6J5X6_WESOR|nr:major facilitator superfamily protein [Westerdykella ornata]KAF2271624.1 major facilitator superfamily protein [Westerdykella ornata]